VSLTHFHLTHAFPPLKNYLTHFILSWLRINFSGKLIKLVPPNDAKMHQIRFPLGLLPRSPAVFKGPTSKGREGKRDGREEMGKGDGKGEEGREEGKRRGSSHAFCFSNLVSCVLVN